MPRIETAATPNRFFADEAPDRPKAKKGYDNSMRYNAVRNVIGERWDLDIVDAYAAQAIELQDIGEFVFHEQDLQAELLENVLATGENWYNRNIEYAMIIAAIQLHNKHDFKKPKVELTVDEEFMFQGQIDMPMAQPVILGNDRGVTFAHADNNPWQGQVIQAQAGGLTLDMLQNAHNQIMLGGQAEQQMGAGLAQGITGGLAGFWNEAAAQQQQATAAQQQQINNIIATTDVRFTDNAQGHEITVVHMADGDFVLDRATGNWIRRG